MDKKNKVKNIFFQISALLILIAAIGQMFLPNINIARYLMIIGVAGFAAVVFTSPYPGVNVKGKRIFNLQIFGVLLMVVSTYLMFVGVDYWVLTLLGAALLTLYCSIKLPRIYKKEKDK